MKKVGLTLGKFAPLHRGHQHVIETALLEMDHVVVAIYDAKDVTPVPLGAVDKNGDRDLHAVSIRITDRPKKTTKINTDKGVEVGQIFEGVIDNIADFGLYKI